MLSYLQIDMTLTFLFTEVNVPRCSKTLSVLSENVNHLKTFRLWEYKWTKKT